MGITVADTALGKNICQGDAENRRQGGILWIHDGKMYGEVLKY